MSLQRLKMMIFNGVDLVDNNATTALEVKKYPVVHHRDWEAVSLIAPTPNGPWIAGGACLRWWQDTAVSENDIDIFCASAKQAADVIERIKSTGRCMQTHKSENASTLTYVATEGQQTWKLQIIINKFYPSLLAVICNFDITVCQVGTDGQSWQLGVTTARDIRERRLDMELPLQPGAAKRLIKYWIYGYRPVPGLLESVQENPDGTWEFSGDDYQ